MNKSLVVLLYAFMLTNFCMHSVLLAQNSTSWSSTAANENWNVGGNWDNGIPDLVTDAFISTVNTVTLNTSGLEVATVKFQGAGILQLNEALNITGRGTETPSLMITDSDVIIANGKSLVVVGDVEVIDGSISGGNLMLTPDTAAPLQDGKILVQGTGSLNAATVNAASVTASGGNVTVENLTTSGTTNVTGGSLNANSLNAASVTTSGGSVSVGTLTTAGDYDFTGGTLTMNLGGTAQGTEYSFLDIGGDFDIENSGTTLEVATVNGFALSAGQTFDLWDVGPSNDSATDGMFASIILPTLSTNLEWDDSQLFTTGQLSITAVPEPSSLAALGMLLTVFTVRRRRRTTVAA
ncbi:PEP-CTERM sorting domain-containing protein [Planctomycetes bacterium K23_9]|uniref:Uncharacterized protein n=1 Tax=Stieleria marina TaxID=1930275 RepID=A0A517NV13_9BACT|nr:hypothetical protein K239x_29490 [Planctomycetes bacterium K23_9]